MTRRKLAKLKRQLAGFRRSQAKDGIWPSGREEASWINSKMTFSLGIRGSMKKMMERETRVAAESRMTPTDYLKRPYSRYVVPDSDGTFRAEIIEFPGCIAVGDTAAEALSHLEDVAASWLESVLANGQRVPEPMETLGFSGKLVVRLPKSLHKKAAHMAAREGVSLNQFIVSSIAERVGHHYVGAPIRRLPHNG